MAPKQAAEEETVTLTDADLQWSFVRDDQPRSETCKQIALAIRDEVRDLEFSGNSAHSNRRATARLGANLALRGLSGSVGCARIPILARSINAPHQRSDTLLQLSRSTAQHSALRRTAGPCKLARSASQWEFPNLVPCWGVQLSRALTQGWWFVGPLTRSGPGTRAPLRRSIIPGGR